MYTCFCLKSCQTSLTSSNKLRRMSWGKEKLMKKISDVTH